MNKSFQRNPSKETHNAVIENRVADVTEAFQLNPFRAAYKMQVQAYYKYLPAFQNYLRRIKQYCDHRT